MPPTYSDLLKQAQERQRVEQQLAELRTRAEQNCKALGEDLKGMTLTDEDEVHNLIEAKFRENGFPEVSVTQSALAMPHMVNDELLRLAFVIVGKYSEAAFNVCVVFVKKTGTVTVYFSQVPKDGNPRS